MFVTASSSELPAFEHHKLMYLQTVCWLPGERSLPIGLLVTERCNGKVIFILSDYFMPQKSASLLSILLIRKTQVSISLTARWVLRLKQYIFYQEVSMIMIYHNHKLQTNPRHCKKSNSTFTVTRHLKDNTSNAASSLFLVKMTAKTRKNIK